MTLTTRIVVAMVLGIALGSCIKIIHDQSILGTAIDYFLFDLLANGLFDIVGQIFIASLRLVIVPLVFVSLVCGVVSIATTSQIGRIKPGVGVDMALPQTFEPREAPGLKDVIIGIFPTNPIAAMAEGNMLQIIIFSLFFGVALKGAGEFAMPLQQTFERLNKVILKLVTILIELAPYGVFSLLLTLFATQGIGVIGDLAKYFFLLLSVLILHGFLTYGLFISLVARLNPLIFFNKMKSVALFAFSTSSSSATMPVTLQAVRDKLGVNSSVSSFTVPLGATINMDGTAIMQGVATVFISQAFNIDISFTGYLMVILTATLASIGTAGVPGVGLIMLAMVLEQVGLPVEGIALIIGVDRLLDMTRTAVNVCGDAMVSCLVGKSENEFNSEIFYSKN